jgi:hypothetical protein
LGKAIHLGPEGDYKPLFFHMGSEDEPPHWRREELNQVLWKFLSDHTAHRIQVLMEHDMTEEMFEYQAISRFSGEGISFKDYVRDWRGLKVSAQNPPLTAPDF